MVICVTIRESALLNIYHITFITYAQLFINICNYI
jgi:hypothetical protein